MKAPFFSLQNQLQALSLLVFFSLSVTPKQLEYKFSIQNSYRFSSFVATAQRSNPSKNTFWLCFPLWFVSVTVKNWLRATLTLQTQQPSFLRPLSLLFYDILIQKIAFSTKQ